MIRLYIEENGGARVFEHLDNEAENSAINQFQIESDVVNTHPSILPNDLRITFVNCLADYTINVYGLSPTDVQLKNIAHSAIALVPPLASKCSDSEIVITNFLQFKCYSFYDIKLLINVCTTF